MILQFFLHGHGGDPVQEFPSHRNRFFLKFQTGDLVSHLGAEFIRLSLDPCGIDVFYLHLTRHSFIHSRGGKHHVGADLPDIFLGKIGCFRKINSIPHLKATGYGHHLLPNPSKGKVGNKIIRIIAGINRHEIAPHGQHIPVGEERALGESRCARCVKKKTDVVAMPFIDHFLKQVRFLFVELPAQFLNLFHTDQKVLVIISHPFGIIPHDDVQFGTLILDGKALIHFFLGFTHKDF